HSYVIVCILPSTMPTEIYPLSLHDALPIWVRTMAEKLGYRPDPALSTLARQRWAGHETGSGAALAYLVDSRMPNYGSHGRFLPSDRKSTRLNSSHVKISYAVFCLKKKKHST